MRRRDFLAMTAAGAVPVNWPSAAMPRAAGTAAPDVQSDVALFSEAELKPRGKYYEATVPDTLDLAERARLAIGGLLNFLDPDRSYELYQMGRFNTRPAYMSHYGAVGVNWGKLTEGILLARHISGSTENLEKEAGMFKGIFGLISEDGHFAVDDTNAWVWKSQPNPTVIPANTARMMLAFMAQNQLCPSERLTQLIARMADSICARAKVEGDVATLPGEFEQPWDELGNYQFMWNQGESLRGMTRTYVLTGDKKYLEMSRKFKNALLDPRDWVPESAPMAVIGSEHGQYEGHIHSWLQPLMGLLWHAQLTNDAALMEFVREGYEYTRTFWMARIGMFGEMCATGDMIKLGVHLSDLGVGDYWEDVDQYVRNHMVELQMTDGELMHKINAAMPPLVKMDQEEFARRGYTTDHVIDRCVGAWFSDASNPAMIHAQNYKFTVCCSGNVPPALYSAWEGIVRYQDGIARVNLLLNRASPWLDLDSYLPYEGKVVIRNKAANQMFIRIPRWVDQSKVSAEVNGKKRNGAWLARYLFLDGVRAGDEIRINFPMVESKETLSLMARIGDRWWEGTSPGSNIPGFRQGAGNTGQGGHPPDRYTFSFKGNTVVDVTPRANVPGYPLYQRDYLKRSQAPLKQVTRYVSPVVVKC
jgi:hypothetical protein